MLSFREQQHLVYVITSLNRRQCCPRHGRLVCRAAAHRHIRRLHRHRVPRQYVYMRAVAGRSPVRMRAVAGRSSVRMRAVAGRSSVRTRAGEGLSFRFRWFCQLRLALTVCYVLVG